MLFSPADMNIFSCMYPISLLSLPQSLSLFLLEEGKETPPQSCISLQLPSHLTVTETVKVLKVYSDFISSYLLPLHLNSMISYFWCQNCSLKFVTDQHIVKSNDFAIFSVYVYRLYLTFLSAYFFLKLSNLSTSKTLLSLAFLCYLKVLCPSFSI